jgi:hypothetical protein
MPCEAQRHTDVAATSALIEYLIDSSALYPETALNLAAKVSSA